MRQAGQELVDELAARGRALEVHGVAYVGHQSQPRPQPLVEHPVADGQELLVAFADHQEHRRPQLAEVPPERLLHSGSQKSQGARETLGWVLPAASQFVGRRVESGEERMGQPPLQELLGAIALDRRSQPFVGFAARGAVFGGREPRRRADQHEGGHEIRAVNREAKAQSSTHRIPDICGFPTSVANRGRRFLEAEPRSCRSPVAGQVDRRDLEVGSQMRGDTVPPLRGASEAVDENHPLFHERIFA